MHLPDGRHLYTTMRNSGEMTIWKTHSTLVGDLQRFDHTAMASRRDPSQHTSTDSTVRVLSLSRFVRIYCSGPVCPYSVFVDFVRCPDSVRIFRKMLSVVYISGRTSTRQSCPGFWYTCPPTFACTTSKILAFEDQNRCFN